MNEWADDVWTAASMYYLQGETMDVIAKHLGTSRSTVSRLLKQARETGLVRISLAQPTSARQGLGTTYARLFGVRATIVPVKSGTTEVHRLDQVARTAAQSLTDAVHDGSTVGIAWGTTLDAVAHHIIPKETRGVHILQMNGSANPTSSGIPYVGEITARIADAFDADVIHFPIPAFFDNPATRASMWKERSIQSVLRTRATLDVAVFGVGGLQAPVPSHVYSSGYLTEEEMAELRSSGVVGDVNTVFLRADGSFDVPFNNRATGMTPTEIRKVPRRICVVAGKAKARALLAALRARVATDLIVDDETARAVLALM